MTEKDAAADAARDKALQQARKNAAAALIEAHRDEYTALLEGEYDRLGVRPKRARSLTDEEREARVAARKAEVEARKEQRRLAKIAALQAELEALKAVDAMRVFTEE